MVDVDAARRASPLTDWLEVLFVPAQRAQTLEALTSGLGEPSHETRVDARLKDAWKRVDNVPGRRWSRVLRCARLRRGSQPPSTWLTALRRWRRPINAAARAVPTREEIAPLLDETAANFGDLFNSESDPGEVNGFLRSIKLQAVVDTVARTASVTADLTPLLVRESQGVSVRVRGGT